MEKIWSNSLARILVGLYIYIYERFLVLMMRRTGRRRRAGRGWSIYSTATLQGMFMHAIVLSTMDVEDSDEMMMLGTRNSIAANKYQEAILRAI